MGSARRLGLVVAVVALTAGGLVAPGSPRASAHTPHDDASGVAVSPGFAVDGVVLAVAGSRVLRSVDSGRTWTEVRAGLTSPAKPKEVEFSPADASRAYLATFGAGAYRSDDGGRSWTRAARGLPDDVFHLAASPNDPDTVIATGPDGQLHLTRSGGRSWQLVRTGARTTALTFLADGTDRIVVGDAVGNVHVSGDSGATWRVTALGTAKITALTAVDGTATLLAGADDGTIVRSDDGGATFGPPARGLLDEAVKSITVSPRFTADATAWASMQRSGAWRTTDGGASWEPHPVGLTSDPQADEVDVSHFREIEAATGGDGAVVLFLAGFDGVFRSVDGAATWSEEPTLGDYVVGLAVSPAHASDRTVAVTTYVKGAYVSHNRGATWEPGNVGLGVGLSAGNKYTPIRRLHNVVFSPDYARDRTLFSATWTRVLRSVDGGHSWTEAFVADTPQLRQYVLAVSPDYASDRTLFAATRAGEIWRSRGGGVDGTWELVGSVGARVRSLVVSPDFAADATLFAGTVDGVVRSTDGGATWVGDGPTGIAHVAISPAFGTDGTVFAGTGRGLFVSTDAGVSWHEVAAAALPRAGSVEALAVSPDYAADATVLVSIRGEGLFRSTDGGAAFEAIRQPLDELGRVIGDFDNPTSAPIQFSPTFATDRTVYAIAQEVIVRSTDGGSTWAELALPPATEFFTPPTIGVSPAVEPPPHEAAGIVRLPVDLSHPSLAEVSVRWRTVDVAGVAGLARAADGDFVAAEGELTFPPGATRRVIEVVLLDDDVAEGDESVLVALHAPVNAVVEGILGIETVTVRDDDAVPVASP